jgi:anti-sigma regulatory factor (Ser/Thr protein kinase)
VSADQITLTLPRERPFFGVAHLVLGGLAVRLDLSYDELEDLQVALAELLRRRENEGEIALVVRVSDHELEASIGPFDASFVDELREDAGQGVGLRRVLDTVVDDVEVTEREGQPWVALRKSIQRTGVAS